MAAATVVVPWDFNGDGRADLAVGAPGEDVSGSTDAGSVSVFLADSSGSYTAQGVNFTQDTEGVPNSAEGGDQFGYALTSGDYDGDGVADLAVGANKEDLSDGGKQANTGLVTVLFGVDGVGLTGEGAVVLPFNPGGTVKANAFSGEALASGDMDGDDIDDLAVGAPGTEQVRIYTGGDPFGTAWTTFSEDSSGVPGKKRNGDLFGAALAMGNFDDDAFADLAVGIPYDVQDKGYSSGALVVVPGSNAGPDFGASYRWSLGDEEIQGGPHPFMVTDLPDSFGRTLAVGDFDGDGVGDLAVSSVGTPIKADGKKREDAGRVHVLFGKAGEGLAGRDVVITQETAGVSGSSRGSDLFGASLDGGQRSSSTTDLLAIGSGEESVRVLRGATGANSLSFNQDQADIPGGTENGDTFGAFVRFLDSAGDGNDLLGIAAVGEDNGRGALFLLPSNGAVPTGAGSVRLDQSSPNAAGDDAAGDFWGWLGDSH